MQEQWIEQVKVSQCSSTGCPEYLWFAVTLLLHDLIRHYHSWREKSISITCMLPAPHLSSPTQKWFMRNMASGSGKVPFSLPKLENTWMGRTVTWNPRPKAKQLVRAKASQPASTLSSTPSLRHSGLIVCKWEFVELNHLIFWAWPVGIKPTSISQFSAFLCQPR